MRKPGTPVKQKELSEADFKGLCTLLTQEEGRTLEVLSRQFKFFLRSQPKWKETLRNEKFFNTHPRIMRILEKLHTETVEKSLRVLFSEQGDNLDLEEGLFQLASFLDPFLEKKKISEPLFEMSRELGDRLEKATDCDKAISIFRRYVFEEKGFHGNTYNYYDPDNSFLNKVIERRTGIPISLSSLCILLAQKTLWKGVPLPVVGIGLPSHFIVQFRFPEKSLFMDPFNRGRTVTKADCVEILKKQDIRFKESYLLPVSSHAIVCRTLTNLLNIFSNLGEDSNRDQFLRVLHILNGEDDL